MKRVHYSDGRDQFGPQSPKIERKNIQIRESDGEHDLVATVRPKMLAGEPYFFEFSGPARYKLPAHNFFIVCGESKSNRAKSMSLPFILLTQPIVYTGVEINDFCVAQIRRVDLVPATKQSFAG
jgi:hypothetical protein